MIIYKPELPTTEEDCRISAQTDKLKEQLAVAKTAEAAAHREYSKAYIRWKSHQAESHRLERQLAEMYKKILAPKGFPRGASTQAETNSQKKQASALDAATKALKGLSEAQLQELKRLIASNKKEG